MNIIDIIKNMFNKKNEPKITSSNVFREEKNESIVVGCGSCLHSEKCEKNKIDKSFLCKFSIQLPEHRYDKTKETILLLDDNSGVISFLEDDFKHLDSIGKIDLKKYNLIHFTNKTAAFEACSTLDLYKGLNVKYAVLDLTLGGTTTDDKGETVMYDGVDVFKSIKKYNNDFKYIFFTGNKLNPDIKKNAEMIQKFNSVTGDNLENHILFKTSLSRVQKREFFETFINDKV